MFVLYRYLMVESEDHESEKDQRTKDMYYTVFKRFSSELVKVCLYIHYVIV